MFKGLTRWLIRNLLGVMLISGLSAATAWNTIELYMKRIVEYIIVDGDFDHVRMADLLIHLAGGRTGPEFGQRADSPFDRIAQSSDPLPLLGNRSDTSSDKIGNAAENKEDSQTWENGVSSDVIKETDQAPSDNDQATLGEDAVPVFGYLHDARQDQLVMSADDFISIQEKLSDEDKITIFSMLVSKVPYREFQHLSYLLEDGLTAREAEEALSLLRQYLTDEEMRYLSNILQ
jgi:hypothetical protein